MFAEIPFRKKIPHLLPVLPVYVVIITVFSGVTYYFSYSNALNSIPQFVICVIFYYCSAMVMITHTKSMFTSPGYVPIPFKPPTQIEKPGDPELFCKKCQNERPYRAHHCKICRKCTLKMDHHCPWVANCVGFYNQKTFYQFLFFATVGDFIGFCLLLLRFFQLDMTIKGNVGTMVIKSPIDLIIAFWSHIAIAISGAVALSMTISIGMLFYFQTKMLLFNQTTIENKTYVNPKDSPYYDKNLRHNFRGVMGASIAQWFSLKFVPCDYNDGYSYTPSKSPKDSVKNYIQLGDVEAGESSNALT